MTAGIRSRRAGGISPEEGRNRPLYARVLGLQYVRPSNLMCFLFFEGTVALAVLLALAELTGWWAVAVLPASVAVMVKVNDVIAGATTRSGVASVSRPRGARRPRRTPARSTVRLREAAPGAAVAPPAPDVAHPGYADPFDDVTYSRNGQPVHDVTTSGNGASADAVISPGDGATAYGRVYRGYPEAARDGATEAYARPGLQRTAEEEPGTDNPAGEEPWLGSAEQRARQSAARRYE